MAETKQYVSNINGYPVKDTEARKAAKPVILWDTYSRKQLAEARVKHTNEGGEILYMNHTDENDIEYWVLIGDTEESELDGFGTAYFFKPTPDAIAIAAMHWGDDDETLLRDDIEIFVLPTYEDITALENRMNLFADAGTTLETSATSAEFKAALSNHSTKGSPVHLRYSGEKCLMVSYYPGSDEAAPFAYFFKMGTKEIITAQASGQNITLSAKPISGVSATYDAETETLTIG